LGLLLEVTGISKSEGVVDGLSYFIFIYLFLVGLGFELRALCLLGTYSYHLRATPQGFFKIGSFKLFAQAGFEL
jgi:hypothetical protein